MHYVRCKDFGMFKAETLAPHSAHIQDVVGVMNPATFFHVTHQAAVVSSVLFTYSSLMPGVLSSAHPETVRSGLVKDVLSGKERYGLVRRYRVPKATWRGYLNVIIERHVLEEVVSLGNQLTGGHPLQLEEMYHVPLFETSLIHTATKYVPPSMTQLKQCLRQMQLSPVSAMIISRNTSTTACLRLRENSKEVFLLLDFAPNVQPSSGLTLILSTTLEQTAARLSGASPIDNHLVTRDKQWQAQLFTNCSIHMFTPTGGASLPEAGVFRDS
ncbi:hypothetical protein BU15DRAFT_78809 [Melanogaster broomeanus]|nr:hypothetical protein BU15DRAFT_78809 [Melanogaster broomeanus]